MQPFDGFKGQTGLAADFPKRLCGSSPQLSALGSSAKSLAGFTPRSLHSGPRAGSCAMLAARAASLGLHYAFAAGAMSANAASSRASLSTKEPSTVPKPGFAPGTPPPPGQPPTPQTPAPPKPPPSTAASSGRGAAPSPPQQTAGAGASPVFPQPTPAATKKSRWSALGWAIPLVGLPLLVAYYNYQREFDKEWDKKVAQYVQEVMAMRQRSQSQQKAQQPSPPVQKTERPVDPSPLEVAPKPPAVPPPGPGAHVTKAPEATAKASEPEPVASSTLPAPAAAVVETVPAPVADPVAASAAGPAASAEVAGSASPSGASTAADVAAATAGNAGASEPKQGSAEAQAPGLDAAPSAVEAAAPAEDPKAKATTETSEPGPKPALVAPSPTPTPPKPGAVPGVAAAEAAALALLQTSGAPSDPLPKGLPEGHFGLETHDLSPLGMVRHAVMSAGGAVTDWSQWPERYAQAVADSRLVFEALTAAAKWHEDKLKEAKDAQEAERQRSTQLEAEGAAAVGRFKEYLRRYTESTKELLEIEVRQAEKRTRLECEKAHIIESRKRAEALDQLRHELSALTLAHEVRVQQAAAAAGGQAVAAGAAAVAAAAESGAPLSGAAAALRGAAAADPLVRAAVEALPQGPVPTRSELLHQFRRLRRDLSALSHFPDESAGLVAVAVARLAAVLKADESEAIKVLDAKYGPGGIDAALARTEALLTGGNPAAAADQLAASLQGTAAAALASDWVTAARRRAAAEAAVAALNAHATATWAALA